MDSTFSSGIKHFFQNLQDIEGRPEFSGHITLNETANSSPSLKTNSSVFILLSSRECEVNIAGRSSYSKATVKKESPEVIVIDSDDSDSDCQIVDNKTQEESFSELTVANIKEEKLVSNTVLPVQSVYLPDKSDSSAVEECAFIEELGNVKNEKESGSTLCVHCEKPTSSGLGYTVREYMNFCNCLGNDDNITGDVISPLEEYTVPLAHSVFNQNTIDKFNQDFSNLQNETKTSDLGSLCSVNSETKLRFNSETSKSSLHKFLKMYKKCPHCKKSSKDFEYLKIHCEFHCPATETSNLECKFCSCSYAGPSSLRSHMKVQHNKIIGVEEAMMAKRVNSNKSSKIYRNHCSTGINNSLHKKSINQLPVFNINSNDNEDQKEIKNNTIPNFPTSSSEHRIKSVPGIKTQYSSTTEKFDIASNEYPCEECGVSFGTESSFFRHLKLHSKLDEPNYKNSRNNITYKSEETDRKPSDKELKKHVVKTKSSLGNLHATKLLNFFQSSGYKLTSFCPICGKYVYSNSFLRIHMRKHTNEKPFCCRKCRKSFYTKVALKYHILTKCRKVRGNSEETASNEDISNKSKFINSDENIPQTNKSVFPCKRRLLKKSQFLVNSTSGRHVTGEKSSTQSTKSLPMSRHFCKCGLSYTLRFNLNRHLKTKSSQEHEPLLKSKPKNFKCSKCDKSFNASHYLIRHQRYNCLGFKKTSTVKDESLTLKLRKNNSAKSFPENKNTSACPYCGVTKRSKGDLLDHISMHTGEKRHMCKKCGSRFGFHNSWARHFKSCKVAGKVCSLPGTENSFMQNVNIEKETTLSSKKLQHYDCEHCGKLFSTPQGLSLHKRFCSKTYFSTQKLVIICEICGKKFSYLCIVKLHIQKHDKISITCKSCKSNFNDYVVFENHLKTDVKPYLCGKLLHYLAASADKNVPSSSTRKTTADYADDEKNIFNCNVCSKKFPSIPILVNHLQEHMT